MGLFYIGESVHDGGVLLGYMIGVEIVLLLHLVTNSFLLPYCTIRLDTMPPAPKRPSLYGLYWGKFSNRL